MKYMEPEVKAVQRTAEAWRIKGETVLFIFFYRRTEYNDVRRTAGQREDHQRDETGVFIPEKRMRNLLGFGGKMQ